MLRRIVWLAIVAAAVAAVAWALRPRPIAVETASVSRGPLTATVGGEGRTRVKDLFVVSAPVDGQLQRISLQAGDAVAADTIVAHIQPIAPRPLDARSRAEARATVEVARAAVARAEASEPEASIAVDHADSLLATSQKLAQSRAVPAAEAEHAGHEAGIRHRAHEAASAAVREARAELARANAAVIPATTPGDAPVTVASPIAGQVLLVDLGETDGTLTVVTHGLVEGDVVIAQPTDAIMDGTRVTGDDRARVAAAVEAPIRR